MDTSMHTEAQHCLLDDLIKEYQILAHTPYEGQQEHIEYLKGKITDLYHRLRNTKHPGDMRDPEQCSLATHSADAPKRGPVI